MICISKKGEKEAKTGSCCVRGSLGARTQEFQRPSATGRKALDGILITAQVIWFVALQYNLKTLVVFSVTGFIWKVVKGLICSKLGVWLKESVQWTVAINNTSRY